MKTKVLAGWLAGACALAFLVSGVYLLVREEPAPKNSVTVAEVVAQRSAGLPGAGASASSPDPSGNSHKLHQLLAAIGLPEGTIDSYNLTEPLSNSTKRSELISTLESAIDQRIMSVNEANAVLKAFDLGIVGTGPGHIIFEETSPH